MSKRVITINRMLGSNGRLIGKALAEELGFAFYDKELIQLRKRIFLLMCLLKLMRNAAVSGVFLSIMNFRWTAISTSFR